MRFSRNVLTLVFVLALAAFLFGLILHSLTYFGVDPRDSIPRVWYSYQIVTGLLFIPIMISGMRATPQGLRRQYVSPQILLACCALFILYAAFNWLFVELVLTHGATPIFNGQYMLTSHGQATTITQAEYLKYRVYEARGNSGHFMALWSWLAIVCVDHLVTRPEPRKHRPKPG